MAIYTMPLQSIRMTLVLLLKGTAWLMLLHESMRMHAPDGPARHSRPAAAGAAIVEWYVHAQQPRMPLYAGLDQTRLGPQSSDQKASPSKQLLGDPTTAYSVSLKSYLT
jgi:hypothetical protein